MTSFLSSSMLEINGATNIQIEDLKCPITLQLFRDPVIAKDGHVYEREAVTRWILEHGTSPLTREPLRIDDLQPDDYLRHLANQRRHSSILHEGVSLSSIAQLSDETDIQNNDLTYPVLRELSRDPMIAQDIRAHIQEIVPSVIMGYGTNPVTRTPLPTHQLQTGSPGINSCVFYNRQNHAVFVSPLRQRSPTPTLVDRIIRQNHDRNSYGRGKHCCTCLCWSICLILFLILYHKTAYNLYTFKPGIISSYSSSLTTSNLVFNRPGPRHFGDGYYYYEAIPTIVSANGSYKFESNSSIDMYGCLYNQSFNSKNPKDNLLVCNDGAGVRGQFHFEITLSTGYYVLVATTRHRNVTGAFSVTMTGPINMNSPHKGK